MVRLASESDRILQGRYSCESVQRSKEDYIPRAESLTSVFVGKRPYFGELILPSSRGHKKAPGIYKWLKTSGDLSPTSIQLTTPND